MYPPRDIDSTMYPPRDIDSTTYAPTPTEMPAHNAVRKKRLDPEPSTAQAALTLKARDEML